MGKTKVSKKVVESSSSSDAVMLEGFFKKRKIARSASEHGAQVLFAFAGVKSDARMGHRVPSKIQRRLAVEPIHTGLEGRGVQYRGFARFKIVDVQQACVRRKTPVLSQVKSFSLNHL